jgi:hypothetical protein
MIKSILRIFVMGTSPQASGHNSLAPGQLYDCHTALKGIQYSGAFEAKMGKYRIFL